MFALHRALDMLFEEGLDDVFLRHRLLAEAVRRAVNVWQQGGVIEFNITDPNERCDTVTTVLMNNSDPGPLQHYCNAKCGVVPGAGFGQMRGRAFRIAHMGHINAPMVLGTLGVVELGLKALGIAHGEGGVQAAISWLKDHVRP